MSTRSAQGAVDLPDSTRGATAPANLRPAVSEPTGDLGEISRASRVPTAGQSQGPSPNPGHTLVGHLGLVVLFVAAATIPTLLLRDLFPYPFPFLFFAAVMVSAWFGGTAAGLLAVVISSAVVDYFFVVPYYSFYINATEGSYFAAFILCAFVASWVSSSKKRSEEALREARDLLEFRVAERTGELRAPIAHCCGPRRNSHVFRACSRWASSPLPLLMR
jgi:Domain of unknown function (DUF4118)